MNENQYIPGVCNIGKAEIEKRKSKLILGLFLILIGTTFFVYLPFSALLFSALCGLTFYTSILIFQIRQRFCVLFGWLQLYNFNETNKRKHKVENKEWIAKDRIQVLKILIYSVLSSATFCTLIYFLAKSVKNSFQF